MSTNVLKSKGFRVGRFSLGNTCDRLFISHTHGLVELGYSDTIGLALIMGFFLGFYFAFRIRAATLTGVFGVDGIFLCLRYRDYVFIPLR